jgi:hypothetical protein
VHADAVLVLVEGHLTRTLGKESGRAGVSFLGTERVDVLRFGPDYQDDAAGITRYVSLGMSRSPMADPGTDLVAQHGPRAELVWSVRGQQDTVLRRLATLAASPAVEGVVIGPGAGLDLGEPLWDGSRFTAVLVGEPGGLVPDLELDGEEPVRFLPLFPMTPNEAAWKRVHGGEALEERWLTQGADLRDPQRPGADLT